LRWQSAAGGGWDAGDQRGSISAIARSTFLATRCTCGVSPHSKIAAKGFAAYPVLDNGRNFSAPLKLGLFSGAVPAGRWDTDKNPLARFFSSASIETLAPHQLEKHRV